MSSQTIQNSEQEHRTQTFVIFNREFEQSKSDHVYDGRFPPTYEEAVGISTAPNSGNVYTPQTNYNIPYPTWVDPTSRQTGTDNHSRSDIPEPYLSATMVTARYLLTSYFKNLIN